MDDRRFDSLTKALAAGKSRRSLLKGLLGLGGAAAIGSTVLESGSEAARRPTPTPKPPSCPGKQTPVGGTCECVTPKAPGPNKCGPDCCTGLHTAPYPRPPTHTECCDNACCDGTCYGEELCCRTNTRSGGRPPLQVLCDEPSGLACYTGTCCDDSDCGDPCQRCDLATHTCVARCNAETEVCCTEAAGPGVCVTGDCCLGAPCTVASESGLCCQTASGTVCVDAEVCPPQCSEGNPCPNCGTCEQGLCTGGCDDGEICCDDECLSSTEFFTCAVDEAGCCSVADACCNVEGCCSGACYGGDSGRDLCCDRETEVYCQPATGPAQCCANAATDKCCGTVGCCTSSRCNEEADVCCAETAFACGVVDGSICCDTATQKCCDGLCISASECCPSTDGDCPGDCEPNCDCSIEANDGLDCNGGLAAGGGVCACGYCVVPLDGCPCGCAGNTECVHCVGGQCVTYNQNGSCNDGAGICQGEWCVDPPPPSCAPNCDCSIEANDGLGCNGGAGGAVCGCGYCVIPLGDCLCGCDGNPDCIQCVAGQCSVYNQNGSCNGGAGLCNGAYCV